MAIFDNDKFHKLLDAEEGVKKGEMITIMAGKSGIGKSAFNDDGTLKREFYGMIASNCPNIMKAVEIMHEQERLEHEAFLEVLDAVEKELGDDMPVEVRGVIDTYREVGGVGLLERE